MTLQEFEKITSNSGVSRDDGNNVQTVQGNLYNWTLVYLPAGNDKMGNSMITIALFQEILGNNTNVSNYVDASLGTYKKNRGAIMCQLYSIRSIQKDIIKYIEHIEKIDAEYEENRKKLDDVFKNAEKTKKNIIMKTLKINDDLIGKTLDDAVNSIDCPFIKKSWTTSEHSYIINAVNRITFQTNKENKVIGYKFE